MDNRLYDLMWEYLGDTGVLQHFGQMVKSDPDFGFYELEPVFMEWLEDNIDDIRKDRVFRDYDDLSNEYFLDDIGISTLVEMIVDTYAFGQN